MKKNKIFLLLVYSILCSIPLFAQPELTADTIAAKKYFKMASVYDDKSNYDSAIFYYQKAKVLYKKYGIWDFYLDCLNYTASDYQEKSKIDTAIILLKEALDTGIILLGENSESVAVSLQYLGSAYSAMGRYNVSLEYYFRCLGVQKHNLGEKHLVIADSYNNIAIIYDDLNEFDSALKYFTMALNVRVALSGSNNLRVAMYLGNIGTTYLNKGNYSKALEYQLKSLNLKKSLVGEKKQTIASSYNNISNSYYFKGEYSLALDYALKALNLKIELVGERHKDVAMSYSNLSSMYHTMGEMDLALDYSFRALKLRKDLFGDNHPTIGNLYMNIGNVYSDENKYSDALDYYHKAIDMYSLFYDEKTIKFANTYNAMGLIFQKQTQLDSALFYYLKTLDIYKKIFGLKHPDIGLVYGSIATVYYSKKYYNTALHYNQMAIIANVKNFNDSMDVYSNPQLTDYFSYECLIKTLDQKANCLYQLYFQNQADLRNLTSSFEIYKKCDQLIDNTRKSITTQSDKIALGAQASLVYENAIRLSLELHKKTDDKKYIESAFYFSEKNKGRSLLDALAGQEGLKFSGIPDSLLQKEQLLKVDINFYEKQLADMPDSATEIKYRNRLFTINRDYDNLIATFEKNYPEYYKLKYTTKNPSVKDIQKLLDKETAIRSYFVGGSNIYIFILTNKNIGYRQVPKISNFDDTIKYFRYDLTLNSQRMKEGYRRIGYLLYQQLFPDSSAISKEITNLIIIPDGSLGYIPFEALLSCSYKGDLENYTDYPYLIKRFNISYSYSANLFYHTFPKEKQNKIEVTDMNDWLALAPVFSDQKDKGIMLASRELQRQMNEVTTDTFTKRGMLLNGGYVSALPGTETETESIFKEFEDQQLKAKVMLHQNANEQFIKSGGLKNYKIIHFATHGFVNSEKPELSGILLDQDTIGGQDGVLYTGELYNLQLNADLIVLSACETGLGKIKKGEGIIGLTRALLYAGTKNIIVSLWQVSDQSTSELMIDFYKILLQNKQESNYAKSLRQAKLNMINHKNFARPFYWSPFILIGK